MRDELDTKKVDQLRKEDKDLFEAIRRQSFKRALDILLDPKIDIPPGQLLAFVAKVGADFGEDTAADRPKIDRQTNILAILPGLPPERAKQIIQQFEKELGTAKLALEP